MRPILWALANAGNGEALDLPLAEDLYPEESLYAAAEAFRGLCRAERVLAEGGAPRLIVSVHPDAGQAGRQVIGEFLNFLLSQSAATRWQQGSGS